MEADRHGSARKALARFFDNFARKVSLHAGHPLTFVVAVLVVLVWAFLGPLAGFSNTWQLVINTGTTIVTFLMVFLIQHSQNHDTEAMRLKLDELIRAISEADDELIDSEDMDEEEMQRFRERNRELAQIARRRKSTPRESQQAESADDAG
jgi:low affinity Fe/Cu permease